MNTGGPAFPLAASTGDPRGGVYCQNGMTLLDWMAGQALAGLCASPEIQMPFDVMHRLAYDHAEAMLAEKARREADHSGDANKMVPDPFAETTLRRLTADVLPTGIKDAANDQLPSWCAEQVRARVNALEASNRELMEALESLDVWGGELDGNLCPPDSNCSCHISPPCNDCVDFAGQREAKQRWEDAKNRARAAIAKVKGVA